MAEAAAATTPQATTNPAPGTAPAAPAQPAAVQRPGVISDQAYDALATPADRDRFARVKKAGDQGGAEWIERSQLEAQPADSSKVAPTGDNTAAVVDGKLQVGDMILSADDIKTLMTQKAANDLKATQVPPSPEGYTAELPKEFKVPPGIEYKFDTSNPAFVDARAWAHREGLTQSQFSQLLSFHANTQIAEQVQIGNAAKAELAKLGDHATARVTAIDQFLRGTLGDDHGSAVRRMMLTAKAVEGIEKLMMKVSSQGAASFRQDGREPPPTGKGPLSSMPDAEYNALSAQERFRISKMGA